MELGARPGDAVAIGGENAVVFDFAPQVETGAEILSRRGEDVRLETERPAAARRKRMDADYHAAKASGIDFTTTGYEPGPEETRDDEA